MSLPSIYEYLPLNTAMALVPPQQQEKTAGAAKVTKVMVKSLAGFGVGTAAGYAGGELANRVFHATTGEQLPVKLLLPAASLLGAGMGLAYSMYKAKELEELQHALKAKRDDAKSGVSSK